MATPAFHSPARCCPKTSRPARVEGLGPLTFATTQPRSPVDHAAHSQSRRRRTTQHVAHQGGREAQGPRSKEESPGGCEAHHGRHVRRAGRVWRRVPCADSLDSLLHRALARSTRRRRHLAIVCLPTSSRDPLTGSPCVLSLPSDARGQRYTDLLAFQHRLPARACLRTVLVTLFLDILIQIALDIASPSLCASRRLSRRLEMPMTAPRGRSSRSASVPTRSRSPNAFFPSPSSRLSPLFVRWA